MTAWWMSPLLIFAGITGPGGYWILDPTAVNAMPHALYYALLGLVLLALGILAIATILAVLWVIDEAVEKLALINGDVAALQALPARDEATA